MSKTQIFIGKARAVHGNRYDYSKTIYVRAHDKIIITCKKHGDFYQAPTHHLNGKGCAICGIDSTATKKTQKAKDSFIDKARAVHGDRYDYSKTIYVRARDKVVITCKKHGDFEQAATDHLAKKGCAKCAGTYSYSTQEWIQEAISVHGDRYDYERVAYVRSIDKVIITCKKHGDFEQTPKAHLSGSGCPKCAGVHRYSTQEWIQEAVAVHGDRYSYDRVVYVRDKDKVIITCKKHGDFEQTAGDHLAKSGCPKCGNAAISIKLSQEAKDNFIEKSRAVHGDKYDYLKTVYFRSWDKVIITCKQHGDFEQTPRDHLQGKGCASCPRRYDQPTNLYLMHNGLGKVKVGYSIDVDARISRLNSNAPFNAELLETWTLPDTPTVRKIESKVHRKLAKYHAGLSGFDGASEWFNTTPDRAKTAIIKALSGVEVLSYSNANSSQLLLF